MGEPNAACTITHGKSYTYVPGSGNGAAAAPTAAAPTAAETHAISAKHFTKTTIKTWANESTASNPKATSISTTEATIGIANVTSKNEAKAAKAARNIETSKQYASVRCIIVWGTDTKHYYSRDTF